MRVAEGLTGTRWPAHPHRQDDELLSSWFARIAHANYLEPQSFGSQTFGKRAFVMTRDIDRCATGDHIRVLSEKTGSSPEELSGGLLSAYEGIIFDRHNKYGNTKWILPSVSYIRQRRRCGMQFCPLCLFFDKQPYYRKRWRMAYVTVCDVHGTMLHDRCPECGAPIVFARSGECNDTGHQFGNLTSCWECGFDLRHAPARGPSGPDGRTIMTLRSLVSFHDFGWWSLGKASIQYGSLYFEVLHRLTQFLPTQYGRRLLDAVERETGWKVDIERGRTRCEFESKPLHARHRLMMAILWLLDDWPERFIRVSGQAKVTQSQIIDGRPFPYWFESVLRLHLGSGNYSLSAEEVGAAADYLKKTGKEISASAIGRLLGRKDAQVVRPYVQQTTQSFSNEELRRIIEKYDAVHTSLPATNRWRLVWQRDRTILLLIQLTGWTYRRIRKLSVGSFADSLAGRDSQVLELIEAYLRDTRRHMAGENSGDALFIKWKGSVLTGESWGSRMQKYDRPNAK